MPRWLSYLVVLALLAAGGGLAFASLDTNWNWGLVWEYRAAFWKGWWMTVALSLAALVASSLIGLVAAIMLRAARRSSRPRPASTSN